MMSTCNPLDLQTLGSQPVMPKISRTTAHTELVVCFYILQEVSVERKSRNSTPHP